MITPTPMKRFCLATTSEYENRVIEELGALGSTHLITEYALEGFKRVDTVEKCKKFVELQERMGSIVSALSPQNAAKKGIMQIVKRSPKPPRSN